MSILTLNNLPVAGDIIVDATCNSKEFIIWETSLTRIGYRDVFLYCIKNQITFKFEHLNDLIHIPFGTNGVIQLIRTGFIPTKSLTYEELKIKYPNWSEYGKKLKNL